VAGSSLAKNSSETSRPNVEERLSVSSKRGLSRASMLSQGEDAHSPFSTRTRILRPFSTMTVESFHDYSRHFWPFKLILFHATTRSHIAHSQVFSTQEDSKDMTMEKLIGQYQDLYQQAGMGGKATNDQMAYKIIILVLQNASGNLQIARHYIADAFTNCPDADRQAIYVAFLEATEEEYIRCASVVPFSECWGRNVPGA
jgi:hypothetical protein